MGICLHMTYANRQFLQNINFYELCTFVNCFGKNAIKSSNINIIYCISHMSFSRVLCDENADEMDPIQMINWKTCKLQKVLWLTFSARTQYDLVGSFKAIDIVYPQTKSIQHKNWTMDDGWWSMTNEKLDSFC